MHRFKEIQLRTYISLIFVLILGGLTGIQGQCDDVETITVCDMTILDGNSDGTSDGVINLYDAYNALPGVMPISLANGTWFDPNFNFALDETNGDLYTWDLDTSSQNITDYQFQLMDTSSTCPDGIVLTINFILGPYSGIAVPTIGDNEVNVEICDEGMDPCGSSTFFDLNQALLSIPSAHTNGDWSYDGSSSNFIGIDNNRYFLADVPYQPGVPLVDEETFELIYTVPGIGPCSLSSETRVKVSVIREVTAGKGNEINVCETELIAGDYDADIDIQDDDYLVNEDIEGIWLSDSDPTGQITGPDDSLINLKEIYDELYLNNQRFGCVTYDYSYFVESRSSVCSSDESSVSFTIVEYLRPFEQTQDVPEFCVGDDSLTTYNLYDLLTFTTENGLLYDYPNYKCTNWSLISGLSDLGLAINKESICVISEAEDDLDYTSLGTVNLANISNADAGTYVFEYVVASSYNCPAGSPEIIYDVPDACGSSTGTLNPCEWETAQVTIIIKPSNYAGEDTNGLEFCESINNSLDLISLLGTNGLESVYQGDLGAWFNNADGSVLANPFVIPEIDGQQLFDFVYTTTSDNGCTDRANLSFTVYEEYNSGTDTLFDICNTDAPINLFDVLEGDPNNTGTWAGPGGFSTTNSDAVFDPSLATPGFYIYSVPENGPCQGNQTVMAVGVIQNANAGPDTQSMVCKEDDLIDLFTVLDASADSGGLFSDIDSTNALIGNTVDLTLLSGGTYDFQYELQGNGNCDPDTSIVTIEVIEVEPPIANDATFCVSDAATLAEIEVSNTTNYNWYNEDESPAVLPLDSVLENGEDYFVASVDNDGCESSRVSITITLRPFGTSGCDDCINDGVSPDGDNLNEELELCDLPETFPNYEINIFNRYGTLVFKGNNNAGLFNGTSNVSLTLGDKLPSSVYFYIFDPKDNQTEPFQGNFYLSR